MSTSRDSHFVDLWLDCQHSPHTRSCYRRDLLRFLHHAGKCLSRVTLADLQSFDQFLAAAGLAPISRSRTLAAVKSLFGFCQRVRYLPANPAAELPLPRYENRLAERIVTEEDVHRMLTGEPHPRNRVLLNILYGAGLRVSEACMLRWRNLSARDNSGQITVLGKNGRTRAIALPAGLWAELISLRSAEKGEQPVFISRSGRPLDRGRVGAIVRSAAQRAGITSPVSPHWLRHAHASHALDHGAPIHLVQATLGHSSVATTSRYLHARPGESSARFLLLERWSQETCEIDLPLIPNGVMNVITGGEQRAGKETNMTIYTITPDNNITAHAMAAEAQNIAGAQQFTSAEELSELAASWPTSRLAEIWNTLPGATPVKKFTDRKTAVTRIWKAIQSLGANVPAHTASEKPDQPSAAEPTLATTGESGVAATPEDIGESVEAASDTPLAPQTPDVAPPEAPATKKATRTKKAPKPVTEKGTREGSKTSRVIELLKREGGVTLKELMTEMGWQSHTTRALMSAGGSLAKKHGLTVVSTKGENGERNYSIKA